MGPLPTAIRVGCGSLICASALTVFCCVCVCVKLVVYERESLRASAIKTVSFPQFQPVFSQNSPQTLRAAELSIHNAGPAAYNSTFSFFFDVV
jgi:hypothetical protein